MKRNVETINPYQPPKGDALENIASKKKTERPVYETRWKATQAGIWRGAGLGLKISTIVSAILLVIMLLVVIALIIFRANSIFASPDRLSKFVVDMAKMFGGLFAVWVLLIIYCSIPGGIIMGLVETIRFRKPN